MNIVFYIIVFVLGSLIGNFYATAIKRISKGKKVLSMHSYCANCGEKLGFFEKIPIFSYIFLKGKCKHCKKKIDAKYIILEFITGVLFLAVADSLNLVSTNFNIANLMLFIVIALYFSYIILAVGIDNENKNMSQSVLTYGVIISLIYMVYMCIVERESIYVNVIYLVMMTLLLLLNIINTKKRAQSSYVIDLLTMLLIMLIFTGEFVCILTITGTLFAIALYILINKIRTIKNKGKKSKATFSSNVRIVFIMGILNLVTFLTLIICRNSF